LKPAAGAPSIRNNGNDSKAKQNRGRKLAEKRRSLSRAAWRDYSWVETGAHA